MSAPIKPLVSALAALEQKRYAEAIELLEMFCQLSQINREYWQAQMSLVQAYMSVGQKQKAIALCQNLMNSDKESVRDWAQNLMVELVPIEANTASKINSTTNIIAPSLGIQLKTLDEFKDFCRQHLILALRDFEYKRKIIVNQITTVGIVIAIIVLVLFVFFPYGWLNFSTTKSTKFSLTILFLFSLAFIGCMYAWVVFYSSATETYANGFRSRIIQQIINFIDDCQILSYSQHDNAEMTLAAFEHSQIFRCSIAPIKLTQNDCVSGKIGDTNIFFSEIRTEIEITHNWAKYLNLTQGLLLGKTVNVPIYLYLFFLVWTIYKGTPYILSRMLQGQRIDYYHFEEEVIKNQVTRRPVFKGLFFQAEFNKNFQGKTLVVPKVIDISKIHFINKSNKQAVQLEDPEFNRLFTVYGEDQVIARYILSTSLIARLVRFKGKAKRNIYISFVDRKIYIAVEYAKDLFEPVLFKTMLSFTPMREYFETLQLMIGIVEELNLNCRIWHK